MNNNNDLGCLGNGIAILLVLIFFAGNGALISGDMDGIEFAVVIAVIADIALVIWLLTSIANSIEKKNEQKRREKLAAIEQEIKLYKHTYEPKFELPTNVNAIKSLWDGAMINTEVVECVVKYKQDNQKIYDQLASLYKEIHRILNFSASTADLESKLSYLKQNEETLKTTKGKIDSLVESIGRNKIQLMDDEPIGVQALKKALNYLSHSEKIICDENSPEVEKFIPSNEPKELNLFIYDNKLKYDKTAAKFALGKYVFCFFEKVILVFNQQGDFISALDTGELKIKVTRMRCSVSVSGNNSFSSEYAGKDSKCIQEGNVRTTWRHTCRDGSPDLRYSYNPRIEYRTDIMEYGTVEINIGNLSAKYTISSSKALDAMVKVQQVYCKSYKHLHDPIDPLLNLFEFLLEEKQSLNAIKNRCEVEPRENMFCKIVAVS